MDQRKGTSTTQESNRAGNPERTGDARPQTFNKPKRREPKKTYQKAQPTAARLNT